MKLALKFFVLIFFICFQIQSFGQLKLIDINPERIQQRKIRKYIQNQIDEDKHFFNDIHPSWNREMDLSSYSRNEMTFIFNGNYIDIWQGYLSTSPSKSWNGKKMSFGLLLQKFPGNIFYQDDEINGVDTGQVVFLNLKLMHGIFNLPVAFEIITIDPQEKLIEFSYIEGNRSSGVQQIKFIDIDSVHTKIIHKSYFKSNSHFRDKYIYPFFHKKIINDFHQNMKRLLNYEFIINNSYK